MSRTRVSTNLKNAFDKLEASLRHQLSQEEVRLLDALEFEVNGFPTVGMAIIGRKSFSHDDCTMLARLYLKGLPYNQVKETLDALSQLPGLAKEMARLMPEMLPHAAIAEGWGE